MISRQTAKWITRLAGAVGLFVLLSFSLPTQRAHAGQFLTRYYEGRLYKVYLPDGYVPGTPLPLVVMLHGCTQNPDDFAAGTEMNFYADRYNFIVAYPDQPSSSNASKCWNWFEPAHQSRGAGEPAIIVAIVNQVKGEFSVNNSRVYVAGMSAGAAMSVILGATYPDVFVAIGESAGLEYKAAHDLASALVAQAQGGPDPNQQGTIAYQAMGQFARIVPTIIFHGTLDVTVAPVNAQQVTAQWAQTNDLASDGVDNNNIDDTPEATLPGQVPGGRSYTQYVYNDSANNAIVIEKYIVNEMRHAWSGGSSAGSYTDPLGPEASEIMWLFFARYSHAPITTPTPASTITPTTILATPSISTSTPTTASTVAATATAVATQTCTASFSDVPPGDTFYPYVRCLACRGIISGYQDGTFRPGNPVTRGQLAKIVSNSAGFNEPRSSQNFEDVPPDSTFHTYVERLAARGIVSGYDCGGAGEPCVPPGNRSYFRPGANVTRGQTSKIVAVAAGLPSPPSGRQTFEDVPEGSAFWSWVEALAASGAIGGYSCGGQGEPCLPPQNRPYFRPGASVTRGQSSKIVAETFFPNCRMRNK